MRLFDNGTGQLKEAMAGMARNVDALWDKQEHIQESLRGGGLDSLVRENVGWRLISGGESTLDEVDVEELKKHAAEARQLRAYNPLVQRGVGVRNAYIWQDAIQYPEGAKRIVEKPLNEQQFFGEEACEELEATLSTDGQYFILVDTAAQEVRRIPFSEITGVYRNPEHNAEIWYYRRTYSRLQTDEATGVTQNDVVEEWHPAITYDGAAKSE